MNRDYIEQRQAALTQLCRMIETTDYAPWDIAMQHDSASAGRITGHCFDSARQMSAVLLDAFWQLREGKDLQSFCNPQAIPGYERPAFPDNAAGGRASALEDAALLITAMDTRPFISFVSGDVQKDVGGFLNGHLHNWLLQVQKQWRSAGAGVRSAILDGTVPKREPEKATFKTMFLVLRECFAIGEPRPSPLINQAAQKFAAQYTAKCWPLSTQPVMPETKGACVLRHVSTEFQEWYFGCGKTQIDRADPQAAHKAEDVFVNLREEFHKRSRACGVDQDAPCPGTCVQDSFDALPDDAYKQKCRIAVDTIIVRIK